jgi:hypothetical protein
MRLLTLDVREGGSNAIRKEFSLGCVANVLLFRAEKVVELIFAKGLRGT